MTRPGPRLAAGAARPWLASGETGQRSAAQDADGAAVRSAEDVDIADAETLTSFVLDRGRQPWLEPTADAAPGATPARQGPVANPARPAPARPGPVPAVSGPVQTRPGPVPAHSSAGPARSGPVPPRPDPAETGRRPGPAPSRGKPPPPGQQAGWPSRTRPGRHAEPPRARAHRLSYGEVALLAAVAGIVVCLAGMCAAAAWQRAASDRRLPAVTGSPASPAMTDPRASTAVSTAPSARLAPTPEPLRAAGSDGSVESRPRLAEGSIVLDADRAATRSGDPREPAAAPGAPGPTPTSAVATTQPATTAASLPATTTPRASATATAPPSSPRPPATGQPATGQPATAGASTRPTATAGATHPPATAGASARPSATGSRAATAPVTHSASAAASARSSAAGGAP
ncbi:hypothetical protein [Pseudofrankia inefficax]|uniref:Uncharacterized protein n=1 Tax=Pseudofrankia inefficax (strain DSM 45817 / CECT 9037 / DDB 130130 / EuI1c) TaxID=298654 RepID=E3J324_PSEI1|nr:hypothetical protein [Pseudofrankia inefficax]ADP82974.1 hypothetical protein FraEuI1c_4985 [Pseudofrankia inefficax]